MLTDIEAHLHLAPEIGSHPADIETGGSYRERIGDYEAQNYTYIPLPSELKYYSTEEGWLRDMDPEQFIDPDTHLMEVLRKLQKQPFLLVDHIEGARRFVIENRNQDQEFSDLFTSDRDDEKIGISVGESSLDDIEDQQTSAEYSFTVDEFVQEYPEIARSIFHYGLDERYGIITIADVNKRGVKQMLYKLISELSAGMGSMIRSKYPDSEEIQNRLRPVTIGRWRKDQMNALEMHISEHMNLLEMMQIIQSSDKNFVEKCGFKSKKDVEKLNRINKIRNRVMHANRSLIYERKEIGELLETIGDMQEVLSSIEAQQ